jgi:sulfate adenylyltransferase subunit 2
VLSSPKLLGGLTGNTDATGSPKHRHSVNPHRGAARRGATTHPAAGTELFIVHGAAKPPLQLLALRRALTSQARDGFISDYADKFGHLYQLSEETMTTAQELSQAGRYELSHLRSLEAEAIHIIREVAAEFERPVLLFSGGKDSIVMLHLALKAFRPGRLPFPVMHVDTGHNFEEVLRVRDELVAESGVRLVVAKVQDDIDAGRVVETIPSRNPMQTFTLLRAIRENKFDAAFGGARRDEEKARAKERVFSFRDEFGQWDPKVQRPELWNLYNGRHHKGEHIRVFPLSNWTEFDIWSYIGAEKIKLPSIYYAHQRKVFERDGMLLAVHKYLQPRKDEEVVEKTVRFRTVGDITCTGCVESLAGTVSEVIAETAVSRLTERGATRADDRISEAGMEDRKREGYF